ncbi:serine/threonine-protein kinase [Streptomyces canus]|uniref:serine/threonine-protein kinase n=1 Tax=Streptomyces canus TaxID=58343 RepID=UPI003720766C
MERGEVIAGRYELVKLLGRGGMGEVWAGRDRILRRDVAVKLLDATEAASPDLPKRFEREAVAAAQINHPGVVGLHDFGVHGDALFLIMEKIDGATLTEHIRDNAPMEPARALAIATEICAALAAAHQASVIHYDIKPHNVMLAPDGRVKVVDFGIAGFAQTVATVARSSELHPAGTPEYGAPEQFLTERGDECSDLYALGGVLFAMLTGRPPFTGPNSLALLRRKLEEEAPRLDTLRTDLPPAISALVAGLLERDPAQRPRSAHQLHEDLTRLQSAFDALNDASRYEAPTKTMTIETPTQPGHPPFEVSWARGKAQPSARTLALPVFFTVLSLCAVGISYYYATKSSGTAPKGPESHDDFTAMDWLIFISALTFVPLWIFAVKAFSYITVRRRATGWSLQVRPSHIATREGTGAQRVFAWNQVEAVTVQAIALPEWRMVKAPACVCLKFVDVTSRPINLKPAGWFLTTERTVKGYGGHAVCVLSPMTERQWTDLFEALARYGGERWKTPAPEVVPAFASE